MRTDRAERYFDSQARIYDATRRFLLRDREKAVRLLDVRPGDRVVDFACGTGMNFPHLLRAGAVSLVGVDASEGMLDRARKNYPDVTFHKGDIVEFSLPGEADKVLCTYALSLVDEWERAILNMKQTLTEEGRLVILDFHPLKGAWRLLDPLFRWWIGIHGVDPNKPFRSFLELHFQNVEEFVPDAGFDMLLVATRPAEESEGDLTRRFMSHR